jgi:hypothetical protein
MAIRSVLLVNSVNGITRTQVESATFLVFLVKFSDSSIYIGETTDVVSSWGGLYNTAWNGTPNTSNTAMQKAVKKFSNPEFYIVALAESKANARALKAAAIKFYGAVLNSRDSLSVEAEVKFSSLDNVVNYFNLFSRRDNSDSVSFKDSDREILFGEIVNNRSKKRLLVTEGEYKGKYISCSHSEREKLNVGVRVKVKAKMMSNGTLKAANSSRLIVVD